MVSALNYSAHAVPSLREFAKRAKEPYPKTAALTEWLAYALDISVKFILPKNGELYDFHDMTQGELDLCRLPYPVIAAEYEAEKKTEITDYQVRVVPKRVALAMEISTEVLINPPAWIPTDIWQELGPGFLVWPIDYMGPSVIKGCPWLPSWAGIYLRYDMAIESGETLDASFRELMRRELPKVGENSVPIQPVILGEYGALKIKELGRRGMNWQVAVSVDTMMEWNAVRQLAVTLTCQNVSTETITPQRKLSEKGKKHKRKLYEYKILVVPGDQHGSSPKGGTHASPRFHLRRGHIRRLPAGGMTWVRACAVGNPKHGVVEKDYAVQV